MEPVLPCLLQLLLVPIISTASTTHDAAVPLAALADLPSFVYYQFGRNFSEQWKKCIEDGPDKCPWYYSVGRQGPCQKGELYLYNRREALRENGSFEPVCQPAPCPDYYSLVIPYKKCYKNEDVHLGVCSAKLGPITNLFGETYCSCDFWSATLLGSKKKECHTLFTQGPCARGSLFVPVNDLVNFGQGQCLPSPCAKLLNGTSGIVEIRLPDGRTDCVEHPAGGVCDEDKILNVGYSDGVFSGLQHLKCVRGLVASAFVLPLNEKCVINDEGLCVYPLKYKPVEPHPLYLEES